MAIQDLMMAHKLVPDNAIILTEFNRAKQLLMDYRTSQKQALKNLFKWIILLLCILSYINYTRWTFSNFNYLRLFFKNVIYFNHILMVTLWMYFPSWIVGLLVRMWLWCQPLLILVFWRNRKNPFRTVQLFLCLYVVITVRSELEKSEWSFVILLLKQMIYLFGPIISLHIPE